MNLPSNLVLRLKVRLEAHACVTEEYNIEIAADDVTKLFEILTQAGKNSPESVKNFITDRVMYSVSKKFSDWAEPRLEKIMLNKAERPVEVTDGKKE